MEADWEVEIGGEAAAIEANWAGFVDLRREPHRASELPETRAFPPLAQALVRLNAEASPLWTAKCDYWPQLDPGSWDHDEMEARAEQAVCASGCYIDLLARHASRWQTSAEAERDCRVLCAAIRAVPLSRCRVDLVVRQAWTGAESLSTGLTVYLTACGAKQSNAVERLAACLEAFVDTIVAAFASALEGESTLQ
jgi:hypothetical protein